jgi:hypothetical protein
VLLQAALLFWNIGLLTMWTDEAFTVDTVSKPLAQILQIVRNDIHPPLYFLLAHAWLRLPLGGDVLDRVRLLSAFWALIATVALDRLWLARLRPFARFTALGFWCMSPTVLLYGRMARSYSMQAALALIAIGLAWRLLQRPGLMRALLSAAATALLLYTHYAPALAVTAAFGCAMVVRAGQGRLRPRLLAGWVAATLVAYLPWLSQFREALLRWFLARGASAGYSLTGCDMTEHALKLAYGGVSFAIGETFPVWALAAGAAFALAVGTAMTNAWRERRELLCILTLAAVLGYFGVAHWVSYPFIPARLLWVLPFLAVAFGVGTNLLGRKVGITIAAIVVAANCGSMISYYSRANFLNKGYAVPLRDIAGLVNSRSSTADSLVLMDPYNTDASVIRRYLSPALPQIVLDGDRQAQRAAELLTSADVKRVWVIANTHDISPGRLTSRTRAAACAGARERRYSYMAYEPWERHAMRLLSVAGPPEFFYEVVECSR